ncbi:MAG: DUF2341 domain-containing protein [Planctomycetia bacterium]|nr:DUF2341 domain-containing protein [Planctomycetia bacterium]
MGWFNSSWLYRKKITLDNAAVTGSSHSNMPIPILISGDTSLRDKTVWDGRDLRFTSSDGTTELDYDRVEFNPHLHENGIWTWFGGHVAEYSSTYDKTWTTFVNAAGDVGVVEYDHATGTATPYYIDYAVNSDDHSQPCIKILASGKLLVSYCLHNGTTLYSRTSSSAGSAASWASRVNAASGATGYNYPAIFQLSGDGDRIYLYYMEAKSGDASTNRSLFRLVSTDDGATWGSRTEIVDNSTERPYFHAVQNGTTRIDFLISTGQPNEVANSLYHFYHSSTGGTVTYYNSAGSTLTPAFAPSAATQVWDGSSTRAWGNDIAIDGSGYPVAAFTTYTTTSTTRDTHTYRQSRWNGSSWQSVTSISVADGGTSVPHYLYSGEAEYSGGIAINPSNVNECAVSRKNSSGGWDIRLYTTADSGASWSASTEITTGSPSGVVNARPRYVRSGDTDYKLAWWCGTYTSFTDYNTCLRTYPSTPGQGKLVAWVKVPTITNSTDTEIYMYYGNSAASDGEDAVNCFSDYTLVIHGRSLRTNSLRLDHVAGTGGSFTPTLTEPSVGTLNPSQIDGKIHKAIVPSAAAVTMASGVNISSFSAITVSCWAYPTTLTAATNYGMSGNWDGTTTTAKYLMRFNGTAFQGFVVRQTDTQIGGSFNLTGSTNTWNYWAFSFDGSNALTGFKNGTAGSTTYAMSAGLDAGAATSTLSFGAERTNYFVGRLEEFRICTLRRDSNWLTTEYTIQNAPATYITYGAEELPGKAPPPFQRRTYFWRPR